jgi:uncharacterized protein (DUF58 family)
MFKRLLFANFRIIYRISQRLRHRLTPAGMLMCGAAIAAGIFGANTRQTLAFQIFSVLGAMFVLAAAGSLFFRPPLRVERRLPRYGTAGEALEYDVVIENDGDAAQAGLCLIEDLEAVFPTFEDFLHERDPEDRRRNWFDRKVGYPRLMGLVQRRRGAVIPRVEVPVIPQRDRVRLGISLLPLRRGYLRFVRSRIGRPDPLGIVRALRSYVQPGTLLVLPRRYQVPLLRLGGHRRYQRGGMQFASSVGDSQEFLSLREYRPGDPVRAIHWRSFAKLKRPVVKEFQDEFFVRQGLVLDTFRQQKPEVIFEEAVSVAASFALNAADQDSLLDLMFVGSEAYRFTSGRGLGQAANMLEILACVRECTDQLPATLTNLVLHHAAETSGLICVLLDWDNERREFVRQVAALDIPLLVFVITANEDIVLDPGPLRAKADCLLALPAGRIQETLDRAFADRRVAA